MDLSVQNSNFLSFLNNLDIDVKQFPEKTFDGLFENIPELSNFFFTWFMENITPDNALTQSEQDAYFQMGNSPSFGTGEEVDFVVSSCSPTFEELMSLDVNYINNFLPEDLDDLEKIFTELTRIKDNIECSYKEVKRKQNNVKEMINTRKKYLNSVKEECHEISSIFESKVEEIKFFLLEEWDPMLDFKLFYDFLPKEEKILKELECTTFLENDNSRFSDIDSLNVLKEDLKYAEISVILSEGFLRLKKVKRDFLSQLIYNRTSEKSYNSHSFTSLNPNSVTEEVKALESELVEKWKILSHYEVQEISYEHLLNNLDLNVSLIKGLTNFKDFIKSNLEISLCLLHILLRSVDCLEDVSNLRKDLFLKLSEHETNFSKDVTSFELRKERFKELTGPKDQNPVLRDMKNVMQLEENPENLEEKLRRVIELMLHANDDSCFITRIFQSDLELAVKLLCDRTLYGPTSQLLYVPVELLVKLQDCEHLESRLTQVIKQVVNKYVDAKAIVSKGDRKILLLWIDFVTNPLAFLTKINQSLRSKNR